MTTPQIIKRSDLIKALQPLHDLIGISEMQWFGTPGITIGYDEITLCVAATEPTADSPRPAPMRAVWHPQGNEAAEYALVVKIEVV